MAVRKTKAGLRLKRWFKEDWRTPRGKKDYKGGENTFRPTKRITKDTPATWSELSKGEKRRAKMEKNTKGRVSRYKKKKDSKKFFLGGLMQTIAMGPLALLGKKKQGKSGEAGKGKLGVGKVLKIKVIGEEGGKEGEGMSQLEQDEARAAKEANQAEGGGGSTSGEAVMKKGGVVKKKRRYVKEDKDDDKKKHDIVIKYDKDGNRDMTEVWKKIAKEDRDAQIASQKKSKPPLDFKNQVPPRETERKYVSGGTLQDKYLKGSGAEDSKKHKRDMLGVLKSKEKKMYVKTGRKPPKKNIFKKGGMSKRKYC
tara:strand:+ start:673 stop:1602 length:930 start_codon:yes stop_codon:yes gene_type:complete